MDKNLLVRSAKFTGRILKHKFWVGYYCFKAGLYWHGITHDLSKFSPSEFLPSVKYFTQGDSPVNVEKEQKGYSFAWLHHRGRNPHHYEYWVDNLDNGGVPAIMPYKYATELICDYLGACHAYSKKFSYRAELDFWNGMKNGIKMHPAIKEYVSRMIERMVATDSCECLKDAEIYYRSAVEPYEGMK